MFYTTSLKHVETLCMLIFCSKVVKSSESSVNEAIASLLDLADGIALKKPWRCPDRLGGTGNCQIH